jgi:hypothetical protein
MSKPIVLAVAGIAIVVAIAWLTTRNGEPAESAEQLSSPNTRQTAATDSGARIPTPLDTADRPLAIPAKAPAEVSMSSLSVAPPSQSAGETVPIDVFPGFEYLNKSAAEMTDTDGMWPTWRRHQQLQSESRDEAWAPRMETALRSAIQDSLVAKGFDTQRIELPVVECRTTGCEIQAVSYSQDVGRTPADLQKIVPDLLKGSLAGEFESFILMHRPLPDQRIGVLAHLPRKRN